MDTGMSSETCKAPGMAHKARNCIGGGCADTGRCCYKQEHTVGPNDLQKPAGFIDAMPQIEARVRSLLPTDYKARKETPIGTGVLDYFSAALAEVARCSKAGNDQHNPGQPLHWARGKSMDHFDALVRHGIERGTIDTDGIRHSAKMAWRALALLQEEMEQAGAAMSRASKVSE